MRSKEAEAGIKPPDIKWLAGAIIAGGVLAPIVLMVSLQNTSASTASLLLNFEGVGTTLIALLFFKEAIGRRAWTAIIVITLASIFLSTDFQSGFGLSLGALGIILACVLWGVDNNFTRNISGKDPLAIVAWKGLVAGTFSFFLALFLGNPFPSVKIILGTLILGFVSYGLSTMLFIRSMRGLGRGAHQRVVWHGSAGRRIVVDCYLWRIAFFLICHCCDIDDRRRIAAHQ